MFERLGLHMLLIKTSDQREKGCEDLQTGFYCTLKKKNAAFAMTRHFLKSLHCGSLSRTTEWSSPEI